jgi:hypothetical protein
MVVTKRWKGTRRPPAMQSIILMCDAATSKQYVADLLVAIRPQFSDIALSSGVQ